MNQNSPIYLVVIAGGSGTRFWPRSTSKRPKQLLSFGSSASGSLLKQTVIRFDGIAHPKNRLIVTTATLKKAIEEENLDVTVLAEPQGRNTAPCVYWAAQHVFQKDPQGIMLVMPADHYIAKPDKFRSTLKAAIEWAATHDDLVTLGIEPSRPETGYGYLRVASGDPQPSKVEAFVEKPNLEKAQAFLESGNYLWNGGMFVWKAKTILAAFDQFMPEMKKAWNEAKGDVEQAYPKMTATSIDYGIMEKAQNVVAFHLDCGWDDLGSWTSLENLADSLHLWKGENIVNQGEVLAIESSKNIVDVSKSKLVALLGVSDLIIAEQGDALLIAHKDKAQDIRKIVEEAKKKRLDLV